VTPPPRLLLFSDRVESSVDKSAPRNALGTITQTLIKYHTSRQRDVRKRLTILHVIEENHRSEEIIPLLWNPLNPMEPVLS